MEKKYLVFGCALALLISLTSCKTYHAAQEAATTERIDGDGESTDADMAAMIAPYKAELEAEMNKVLCVNEALLSKGKPESTLTNWFADALMACGRKVYGDDIAFAVQNYGGIRRSQVGSGDITVGLIYELMPFDNEMVVITTDGKTIKKLVDHMAEVGGWPVSKELNFVIKNDLAYEVSINGQPLNEKETYKFLLPDYIANGGDGLFFLSDLERDQRGVLIRTAIIEHLATVDKIGVIELDQRIKIIE